MEIHTIALVNSIDTFELLGLSKGKFQISNYDLRLLASLFSLVF